MSVYFITCREADSVKIGNSLDPRARLREIQRGCPLPVALEAVLDGNQEQEFELHRRFDDDRMHGEWFRLTPLIEQIIANNPAPQGEDARPVRRAPARVVRTDLPSPWVESQRRNDRRRYQEAMTEMRRASQ